MVLFDDVGDAFGDVVVVTMIMITMMIMRIGEDHEAGVLTRDQFGDSQIRNCVTEHFKVQIWRLFSQQVDPQRISIRPPPYPPPPYPPPASKSICYLLLADLDSQMVITLTWELPSR